MRQAFRFAQAALAAAVIAGGAAAAQAADKPANYPMRPISLVVVYPAGGGMDVTARTLASVAEKDLGHEFRVENRTGGGGVVGHTYLAKEARPDGYTIGVVGNPFLFSDFLAKGGQFDQSDFKPIAGINFDPVVWVVRADSPLGKMSFQEIIEKAKSDKLRVGVMPNNVFEFVTEIVERDTGVDFETVPFQGGQPGVTALLRGDIDITNGFYAEVEQYIKSGDLKAVAVSDTKRLPFLPDTPAMSEVGVDIPGSTWGAFRLITVPPATPDDVTAYLADSFYEVLTSDDAEEAFKKVGMTLSPTDMEATRKIYQESYDALSSFLKESGRIK